MKAYFRRLVDLASLVFFSIFAGVLVALGLCYRVMSAILFFGYNSLLLMEATQYVNHFYLHLLISFWLVDSDRDLSRVEAGPSSYDWIMKRASSVSESSAAVGYKAFRNEHRGFQRNAQNDEVREARAQHL